MTAPRRIVLGISGASGMPYALRLLEVLSGVEGLETHVVVSDGAKEVLRAETKLTPEDLETRLARATRVYSEKEIGGPPASGSWQHQGMVVCPCSMASLGAIANGLGSNLLHRSADVTLKEKRPLVLVVRETPLNLVHLRNMTAAVEAGATIMPAMPGFYTRPTTISQLVDHLVARILDQLGVDHTLSTRWEG
ncbi:phenolic acid decarboxylase subunit B [Oceanidesulfovibrio indonesiensis]|uniref:Flavin prenyltransferase UbiX n=1 Tax=Oceanidesulfovibrio indonesiensis TaxID=54767 RepID=A0A7M3MIQ5_9BACT|nr:UbiX family flavin prenyltransferase [Oceanidesulfovibrio indonesiensis]TVM19664.1 phenolic acid decarboxylase subunit B [Oceanidesulfovibrio indonesiensis]